MKEISYKRPASLSNRNSITSSSSWVVGSGAVRGGGGGGSRVICVSAMNEFVGFMHTETVVGEG